VRSRHVDVTMGSARFHTLKAGSMEIVHAHFPPNAYLPPHTHGRPLISTMLDGSFDTEIRARRIDCTPRTVWTEPLAETHSNRAGARGARVLVIQPHPDSREVTDDLRRLFDEVHVCTDPRISINAARMVAEFDQFDDLTSLAVEALALDTFVVAARLRVSRLPGTPRWLSRVKDSLRDNFAHPPRLAVLAGDAGVEPSHLCHEFRRRMGMSIGAYVRSLRLEWSLAALTRSASSIAEIALRAGYSDQAHFTRCCRQATGLPPAALRRASRRS
jgi:AraC family transcriptional regulator